MLRKPPTKALDAWRTFNCSFVTVTAFGRGAIPLIGFCAVNDFEGKQTKSLLLCSPEVGPGWVI